MHRRHRLARNALRPWAAIALSNQLILVTRNVDDFSMYSQLVVENWFSAQPN
ncbi:hypothetical protein VSS37_10260 [Candidatus Thiothrix sp. Deng01]|uniref:Type II toxin-antitoxin system VapC family toxin n=1 Tax=Candidatus Thiothrix phosphatis TaxID=3112415 RepID=A0ABU6CXT7_9GAMM|nr:hypothetical protein [Candidatus Thiothrix sp. Deng01]MEB4591362.1 hypothetical protein [Candidatus Thiothrix sp. Deng01]